MKDRIDFRLFNPDELSVERIIDDLMNKGVQREESSGNISWFPPTEIQNVYFNFDK